MKVIFVIPVLMAAIFSGCSKQPSEAQSNQHKPVIIASMFTLYDFARHLAGTNMHVVCPVPPGVDPHSMEPTPAIAKQVASADGVFLMGLGMDVWLEKLAQNNPKVKRMVVSDGIPTMPATKGEIAPPDHEGHSHAHHLNVDPHIWMDPVRARQIVIKMAHEMKLLLPEAGEAIDSRATNLVKELDALNLEYGTMARHATTHEIITFHGAFGYLFKQYGLRVLAVIEVFPGDQPSAQYLREVVELTRKHNIHTIFAEPQLPDGPARVIAQEIGGNVERLDPCETLLRENPNLTYVERQKKNIEVLRRVLGVSQ
jgi:zinc transport system substrate-binding protein